MELDEFINKTLVSIFKGIQKANDATKMGFMIESNGRKKDSDGNIQFDVAVITSKKNGSTGKAGIEVFSVGIGGSKTTDTSNQIVSRIKFSVASDSLVGLK